MSEVHGDYLARVENWAAEIFHAVRRNPDPSRVEIRAAVWKRFARADRKPTADEWTAIENRVRQKRAAAREREVAELLRFDPLAEIGLLRAELGDDALPVIADLQEAIIGLQAAAMSAERGDEIHPAWQAVHEALKRLAMFRTAASADPLPSDHLDEKDLRILQAVYDATQNNDRTTYEVIAPVVMSFHEASKQDVDRKGRRLVNLGLMASKSGRGGGIWLTEAGVKRCNGGKSN